MFCKSGDQDLSFLESWHAQHEAVLSCCLVRRQPNFPEAQSGIFANLIRWYDFLSHTADPANVVPKVKITKAPFRMPPPPALAPKASTQSATRVLSPGRYQPVCGMVSKVASYGVSAQR